MAELIGVIASAITFGTVVAQLATSINQLKECWEEVRDAPEDLKWLIRDIEIFGLILAEVEDDLAQESVQSCLSNRKSAIQCFTLCKEASEELQTLVQDFRRELNSRNRLQRSYAAVKMVMQKNKVKKYTSRLKNIAGLLMLAQQCYTRALVQAQHELAIKGAAPSSLESRISSRVEPERTTLRGLAGRRRSSSCSQNTTVMWRFEVPSWMAKKALELAGLRNPDGWKFAFRTYNIISLDSKAVEFAQIGNIQGLQELFALRQASPFDRVEGNGYTLLHYANGPKSEEVFEFLLNQGADQTIAGNFNRPVTPLQFLVWSGSQNRPGPLLPSMRLLLSHSEDIAYETPEETIDGLLSDFHGTAAEFRFLQQECCPGYYHMPQSARVAVAARIASGYWDAQHMPELIRAALGKDPLSIGNIQLEVLSEMGSRSTTLMHSIAGKIGRSLADLHCCQRQPWRHMENASKRKKPLGLNILLEERKKEQTFLYESWNTHFCELLAAKIDIHKIVGQSTPFSSFLSAYFKWCIDEEVMARHSDTAIKTWLGDLQATGLDLEKFGQIEERLLNSGQASINLYHHRRSSSGSLRLISFTYGSSPDDWHLWMSEPTDSFVGDFWSLIEWQEEVMPGSWPEDVPYKSWIRES